MGPGKPNQGGRAPVWRAWLQARRRWRRPPRRGHLQEEIGRARVERERGVRGARASGHGRAVRWRGRCAHSRQLFSLYPPNVGRVIGTPVSRRRQGRGAAHRRRLGRARVPSGVAAAGNVWGHCSALEGFALHLPPNAMAQPVSYEGEVGRGSRRMLGWAQGGCRVGRTSFGPSSRRERPHLGWQGSRRAWKRSWKNVGALGRNGYLG